MTEEALARKTKELETVLKEKKCSNCILCTEDVPGRGGETGSSPSILADLNGRLVKKV